MRCVWESSPWLDGHSSRDQGGSRSCLGVFVPIANRSTRIIVASHYIEEIKGMRHRMDQLHDELECIRSLMLPHGVSYEEAVTTSPSLDAMGNRFARYAELEERFALECEEFCARIAECHTLMGLLPAHYARALTLWYVSNKNWGEIAREMGYTRDGIMRIRRNALNELYDHIPEEYRRELPKAV